MGHSISASFLRGPPEALACFITPTRDLTLGNMRSLKGGSAARCGIVGTDARPNWREMKASGKRQLTKRVRLIGNLKEQH